MSELRDKLMQRLDGLKDFVAATDCAQDQKHLDAGTTEREYWHHGYAVALNDVLDLIGEGKTTH